MFKSQTMSSVQILQLLSRDRSPLSLVFLSISNWKDIWVFLLMTSMIKDTILMIWWIKFKVGRLVGWKCRLLSQATRLTLIKSVIQYDPVYKFPSFQASQRITKFHQQCHGELLLMLQWGKTSNALLEPAGLVQTEECWGLLGLRDYHLVYNALLEKHTWRILERLDFVVSSRVQNKYLVPYFDFQFKRAPRVTLVWRGIRRNSNIITNPPGGI